MARDVCSDILCQPCSKPVNESKLISSSAWPTSKGRRATSTPIEREKNREGERERGVGCKRQRLQFKLVYVGIPSVITRRVHSLCIDPSLSSFLSPFGSLCPSSLLSIRCICPRFVSIPQRWIFGRICGWISVFVRVFGLPIEWMFLCFCGFQTGGWIIGTSV